MSKTLKRIINVGLGKETVRGTAATPGCWCKVVENTMQDKLDTVQSERTMGVVEDSAEMDVIKKWGEGALGGELMDSMAGYLFLGALGAVSSAVKETSAYNHTFTVAQSSQRQSLTVDVKFNDIEHLAFANSVISKLEIEASPKEYVKFNATFKGKAGAASVTTPSYTDENDFVGKDVTVKIAADVAGLSGASALDVKNLKFTITNAIEDDDVLGSLTPSDFLTKQLSVEGSMELLMSDTTYKTLALAGTQKAMLIDIKDTAKTIGATSNPEIAITLPKIKIKEFAVAGGVNDMVKQTIQFKGLYDTTTSKMISVVVTNIKTAY